MIRHHVLINFNGDHEAIASEVMSALQELPGLIPEIQKYEMGADLGLSEGAAHVALVGEFASVEDYQVYATHPAHLRVIDELIKPNVASLVRSQIEL